ncbi:MAG: alpha/beta hydrolase [Candidatus Kapaibacterium sp.]
MKLFVAGFILFLLCLNSCSSTKIELTMTSDKPYPDSSYDFSMATSIKKDTIFFGSSRLNERVLPYRSMKGDSLNIRIWFPGGQHVDSTKLILLVPGFHDEPYELFPLAIASTKRGIITAILSPRSIDVNRKCADDFGINEIQDAEDAFSAYQKTYNLPPLKIAAFGCSLGSVVALNLAVKDARVQVAVCESMMSDPVVTSKKLLSSAESDELQSLISSGGIHTADFSPETVIKEFPKEKKLFVDWGEKDKLISPEEQAHLQTLIGQYVPSATFKQIPGIGHVLRYGFPLSQQEALLLNEKIISFLVGSL